MGIDKKGFDYKYSLEKDVLKLEVEHRQYKFKIENNEVLENVHNIATLIIKELRNVDEKQKASGDSLGYYAKLLLATLNISEKYTKLEKKYAEIRHVMEELHGLKTDLKRAMAPRGATKPPISGQKIQAEPQGSAAEKQRLGGTLSAHDPKKASAQIAEKVVPSVASDTRAIPEKKINTDLAEGQERTERPTAPSQTVSISSTSVAPPSLARSPYIPFSLRDTAKLEVSKQQKESLQLGALQHSPSRVRVSFETCDVAKHTAGAQPAVSTGHVASDGLSTTVSSRTADVSPVSSDASLSGNPKEDDTDMSCAEKSGLPDSPSLKQQEGAGPSTREPQKVEKAHLPQYLESNENSERMTREDSPAQIVSPSAASLTSPIPESSEEAPMVPDTSQQPAANTDTFAQPHTMAKADCEDCDSPLLEIGEAPDLSDDWTGHDIDIPGPTYPHYAQVDQQDEYQLPLFSFLSNSNRENLVDQYRIRSDAELLEKKLGYFGIKGEVMGIHPGPVITTYEYKPDPGIKISKIVNLADDLALALSAYSIRIVAPIPGKDVMGIEIPNAKKDLVPFVDIVTATAFQQSTSKIPICLGKDIVGNPVVVELDSMPHLLIAGATGTGKSVGLNAMITSILYKSTPDEVRFLMIDPKRIELSYYNDIGHLLTPVITDMNKANTALQWLVREMDRRYNLLAEFQVRHIEQFNQKLAASDIDLYDDNGERLEPLPYIVVIIDELADLMMTASRDIEFSLTRLAQMARAAGIHLILATQRPSVDVLTGIIKANFPTRISFQVSSKTDSRTIIDSNGAETLLGNGDMLFVPPGTARLTRVHGTYLSEEELVAITTFIKQQRKPDYIFDVLTEQNYSDADTNGNQDQYDEKYNEALDYVMATRQASISGVQRALRVGYNRAARIIDLMEKNGIVGPSDGVKPRKVLVNTTNLM